LEKAIAKALVSSFLNRLRKEGDHFQIPGSTLSRDEVEALSELAEVSKPVPVQESSPKVSEAKLNLAAFDRSPVPEDAVRLCLDFGTAMSKAWASASSSLATLPLVLGKQADGQAALAVPSSIFIAKTGAIFFGSSAERQHEAEIQTGRYRFDNIKRLLSDVEPGLDVSEVPLSDGIDPTGSGLTKGDLLVLYLAWLTDLSLRALTETAVTDSPELAKCYPDLRSSVRRYAIPCFEDAVDDVPSAKRAKWAQEVLSKALLQAQIVADTLCDEWPNLTTHRAKSVLDAVKKRDVSTLESILAHNPSIREPVAAGATQFEDFVDQSVSPQAKRLMLVIDAGAGTTDFALFQSFYDRKTETSSFALISSAVRMSRIAGNRFDHVLRPLMLRACKVQPENGSPWNAEDFAIIKADLDSQIRALKRRLFTESIVSLSFRPGASGLLTLDDVVAEPSYQELGRQLLAQRDDLIAGILTEESIERYRKLTRELGKPVPIHVLLTGGSSKLPIFANLAEGEATIREVLFKFEPIQDLPQWIDGLPREQAELVATEFSQCAVAIGGCAPTLPREMKDLAAPVTPHVQPGKVVLTRYQVTGV
jgi:molecular chaperone HscA